MAVGSGIFKLDCGVERLYSHSYASGLVVCQVRVIWSHPHVPCHNSVGDTRPLVGARTGLQRVAAVASAVRLFSLLS